MDDESLIETLLYKGEGTTLDYKLQQYPHDGATQDEKGELLKDILAFANAWRTEPAYILIGISNSQEVVGLDKDLDDSRLQQFINGKTNTPVDFSYRSVQYKGVKLGLYTIPVQDRPIFPKQQFGKVLANNVYVRRGSATDIAKPDEIAKMGAERVAAAQSFAPILELEVLNNRGEIIDAVEFTYENLVIANLAEFPKYVSYDPNKGQPFSFGGVSLFYDNADFYREKALQVQQRNGLFGFKIRIRNSGTTFSDDVRIYLSMPASNGFNIISRSDLLPKPKKQKDLTSISSGHINFDRTSGNILIASKGDKKEVVFRIGKIQSGETIETHTVYLVRPPQGLEKIDVKILSDQLRAPLLAEIPVRIQESRVRLTQDLLERIIRDE